MNLKIAAFIIFTSSLGLSQTSEDSIAILNTFQSWGQGWAEKNVTLAIEAYAEDIDWTNAFGDRFIGKENLRVGLEFIFSLPFVMAGGSSEYEYIDLKFLSPDIALVRSKLIRAGQRTSKNELMPDRHINHLRVYQKIDGEWKIISHLIADEKPKK